MTKKTAHQIDAEAAGWAARIDRGPLEPGAERAFQAWLQEDARCAGAFARVRALALSTERARALGPDFDPSAFGPAPFLARRTALKLAGAIAASALIAVTVRRQSCELASTLALSTEHRRRERLSARA